MAFFHELLRTWDTITLLPYTLVSSSQAIIGPEPSPSNDTFKWIVIQLLVVYFFYRHIIPFLSSQKVRSYWKARTLADFWIFTALVIKSPSSNENSKLSSFRLFASMFAIFLVSSHLALAAMTLFVHVLGRFTQRFFPGLINLVFIPSHWHFPSFSSLLRASLLMSTVLSLIAVGCTIEARETSSKDVLPLICRMPIHSELAYLNLVTQVNVVNSPLGLLWISFLVLYAARGNTRLRIRQRIYDAFPSIFRRYLPWSTVFQKENNFATTTMGLEEPEFLEMSEWYSVAMVDTAVELLISLKLFFGRFDVRALKHPKVISGVFEERDEDEDFIFDWIADTGDGGNSTYTVARALAKPYLFVQQDPHSLLKSDMLGDLVLPRAKLLLIGGDLSYPSPSFENYEQRLFAPFSDALEPPSHYRKENVSVEKPDTFLWSTASSSSANPVCFAIPGNHDYFDGLNSFSRCVLNRDFLGGWALPQTSTYFALQLPQGWWIFAFDCGLGEDIDTQQFRYFHHLAKTIHSNQIIVVSHEPVWLYDGYSSDGDKRNSAPILKELLFHHLKDRVALRICGDLHNYMRYEEVTSGVNLVVSGGGGAFTHPTHVFPLEVEENGGRRKYALRTSFPDFAQSAQLGLENLGSGFRVHNWRFDFVGAITYFLVCFSLFPRCGVKQRVLVSHDTFQVWGAFVWEMVSMVHDIFTQSIVSALAVGGVYFVAYTFAEQEKGAKLRIQLAWVHGTAHVVSCLCCFLLLQLIVEIAIEDELVGKSYYALFDTYFSSPTFSADNGWSREILKWFDIPEAVAVPHVHWCSTTSIAVTLSNIHRAEVLLYYLASFAYLYVLSTDVYSGVIGIYLAIGSSWFRCHWNEAFSSLRNPDFKHFLRFRICKRTAELHCFVLGMDKSPQEWMLNPKYESTTSDATGNTTETEEETSPSSRHPSKWVPLRKRDMKASMPRLIDSFVVKPKREHKV